MLTVFVCICILLAGHCIGDYPMQGEFLAINKSKDKVCLLAHCIIYTFFFTIAELATMLIHGFPIFMEIVVYIILIGLVTHLIIDKWKCSYRDRIMEELESGAITKEKMHENDVLGFYIDQALHIFVMLVLYASLIFI